MTATKHDENIVLDIEIPGLPKRTNNSQSSWRARMAESRKWKMLVADYVILMKCFFGLHDWYSGLNDPDSLYHYCGACGAQKWRETHDRFCG